MTSLLGLLCEHGFLDHEELGAIGLDVEVAGCEADLESGEEQEHRETEVAG